MFDLKRPALLVAASVAAATLAAPAFATTSSTTLHHTSLNARATKDAVKPGHKDRVVLTLRSGKKGIAGEESNFLVRMRRDVSTSSKWGAWMPVTATPGTKDGRYRIEVTMPASTKKGHKEQYEVKFAGDATHDYAKSRSHVFTVKAS
jgi:hypothetical protein